MLKPPRNVTKTAPAPVSPGQAALDSLASFAPAPVKQPKPTLAPVASTGTSGSSGADALAALAAAGQSGATGSFGGTVEQTDFDITGKDLKSALKKTPKTLGVLTALAPSGVLSMVKAATGFIGGTPSEFSKTFKGGGTLSKIPIASLFLTKEGEAIGTSFKDTFKDLQYIVGGPKYVYENGKPKIENGKFVIKDTDRISKALALGESPAPFIIEDFGNLSLAGGVAGRAYKFGLVNAAKNAVKVGAFDESPAANAAQAAAREAAVAKMARRGETVEVMRNFTRATEKVAAAPMYPYIYGFRGARYVTDHVGRAWADRWRRQADNLDDAGDTTKKAEYKRKAADNANRFFGTPVRDPYGNTIYNDKGKPVIIQRASVAQWAKDKLRRQETTTSEIQNAVVDQITKPPHFETDGEITPAEQQAAAALRNGFAASIHFISKLMPEIPLEEWRVMSLVNEHPDYHVSLEGLQLAIDFMDNKVQNPNTRDRVDFVVQTTDRIINQYISEPSRQGYGVDNPLDPYQDLPLPEINRLREALKDSGSVELLEIMDRLIEGGLADLAIDDPVRTRWLAVLVEAAPDSVSGDPSIWPATMRNRIEQVRAMREWFDQKAAQVVMGDPPPEGGPRNFDPTVGDPNAAGIPTVEDMIRNPQPGSLPRIASKFINNAIKSMNALQGKSRVLAQNLVDIHIKIAEYERHMLKMHLQLKELEGMWVNNRGREVFPDKNGNLPKSAKRIPGAIERAQELRDTLRAKYEEMVAAQDQTTVVDGKVVTIEEMQANLEKVNGLLDDMQTKVDGIDQAAIDILNAKDTLHNKSSQMAALLGLDGIDAAPIRAAIEEDMANLPEDLQQTTVFDAKYDEINKLIDYVNRVQIVHTDLMKKFDEADVLVDSINEQLENAQDAFDNGKLTQEEFDATSKSLEENLAKAEAEYATIDDLTDQSRDYFNDATDALQSKMRQTIKNMPEQEALAFADLVNKQLAELRAEANIAEANENFIDNEIDLFTEDMPDTETITALVNLLESRKTAVNANLEPELISIDTKAMDTIKNNQYKTYAVIQYNASYYEVIGGANNGFFISPVDLGTNLVYQQIFKPFRYDKDFKFKLTEQDILKLKKATPETGFDHILKKIDKAIDFALEKSGVAKADIQVNPIDEIISKLALNKSKLDLQLEPLLEAQKTAETARIAAGIAYRNAETHVGFVQKALIERISGIQKLKSKTTSKDTKEAIAAADIEASIVRIDDAILNYERTGNWYGETFEVDSPVMGSGKFLDLNVDAIENVNGIELPKNPNYPLAKDVYENAILQRDLLQETLETALAELPAPKLKTVAEVTDPTPVKINALKEENWTRIDGDAYIDTGTRQYKAVQVERGTSSRGKTLYDHNLQRIGSDGLPFENMTMVFKSFAALRKYVDGTIKTDAEVLGNLPKANYDRPALTGPRGLAFPKDLLDAEARLAKTVGKRSSLLSNIKNTDSKLTKLRAEESAKATLLPIVQARANSLEARINREVITQPGLTQVNGVDAPVDQATGNRLRPRVIKPADVDNPDVAAVMASINEANMARARNIPFTMPMRAAMEGRPDLTSGYDYAPSTRGFGYVPAGEMQGRTVGATRTVEPGVSGKVKLRQSHYRAGTSSEIYSLREMADRIVAARRGMDQNETIKLLMHSGFSTSAASLLGQTKLDELTRLATERATREGDYAVGRTNRDFAFDKAVKNNLGELIDTEMRNRGWEANNGLQGDIKLGIAYTQVDAATRYLPRYMRESVASRTSYFNPAAAGWYLRTTKKATTMLKNAVLPFSLTWQLGDAIGILTSAHATNVPLDVLAKNMVKAFQENYGGGFTDIFRATENRKIGPLGSFLGQSGLQDVGLATDRQAVLRGFTTDEKVPFTQRIPVVKYPFKAFDKFKQSSYRLNEAINRVGRQAYFMTVFQKALDDYNLETNSKFTIDDFPKHKLAVGSDPAGQRLSQAFWDTVNQANDVLGDWLDLTPYERRVVLPHVTFYAWIKHINKLFLKIANDDPAKIMWHMYLGTMAYDDDFNVYEWLARNPVLSFAGGVTNLSFASQWSDFFNGPIGSFVLDRDIRPAMRTLGPSPRLISAGLTGIDLNTMKAVSRPTGSGAYDPQGFELDQGLIFRPGEAAGYTMQTFPIFKKLANLLPSGDVPFTDIQTGPVKRFGTGATRTVPGTNLPVPEVGGRANALMSLFNVPGRPIMSDRQVQEMKIQQRLRLIENKQARLRYEIMKP